jgi:hypothetical protein
MQRRHGDNRVSNPQRGLAFVSRLGPVGNRERGSPSARRQLRVVLAVGGKPVPATFDLNDQQRLLTGLTVWSVPGAAQRQPDLSRRGARAMDTVDSQGEFSGSEVSHSDRLRPLPWRQTDVSESSRSALKIL